MSDPFPVKKRDELLRQRIEQVRRNEEWSLLQNPSPHTSPREDARNPRRTRPRCPNGRASLSLGNRSGKMITSRMPALGLTLSALVVLVSCAKNSAQEWLDVQGPSVSADGKTVVFKVDRRVGDGVLLSGELVSMDSASGSCRTLMRAERRFLFGWQIKPPYPYVEGLYGLSWSPDSKKVFAAVRGGDEKTLGIWEVPVSRENARRLLFWPLCERPRASPDGKWIVFYDAFSNDLLRIEPHGAGLLRLTDSGDVNPTGFDWTPDSREIHFATGYMRKDKSSGIWKMKADGTDKVLLLEGCRARAVGVSPSSRYLAFASEEHDLYVLPVGEATPTLVSRRVSPYFNWSPHSDILLYAHHQDGLYEWQAATTTSRRLVSGDVYFPAATPDGKTVLFLRRNERGSTLWRLDVASGKTEQIYPKP